MSAKERRLYLVANGMDGLTPHPHQAGSSGQCKKCGGYPQTNASPRGGRPGEKCKGVGESLRKLDMPKGDMRITVEDDAYLAKFSRICGVELSNDFRIRWGELKAPAYQNRESRRQNIGGRSISCIAQNDTDVEGSGWGDCSMILGCENKLFIGLPL